MVCSSPDTRDVLRNRIEGYAGTKVYLAKLRLKGVATDFLVTAYEPIVINPLSESAIAVGAGVAVPAAQSGCMPMAEIFQLAATSFKVNDWSLFGAAS